MKQRLLFVVIFLICALARGQETKMKIAYDETPLIRVIQDMEDFFSIQFSFNVNRIEGRTFSYSGVLSLDQLLIEISKNQALEFQKIDASNYVIQMARVSVPLKKVCGIVVDAVSGEPLSMVTVSSEGTARGTLTAEDGSFSLKDVHDTDQLTIQYLGYVLKKMSVSTFPGDHCPIVTLQVDTTELDTILITEYVTTGFDRDNGNGSIQITPKKLGILPGLIEPDVLQSLQWLPGISSPSESASNLHFRGGTPDQNLVLWDGIKMYHQGHFFGQISAFNPYITEEITLFRSGTSAKYGDRISGVIDIQSTQEVPSKLAVGGGVNFTQADFYVKVPLHETFGVVASARRSYSDLFETITFQKLSDKVFQNTKISEGSNSVDEDFEELRNDFRFSDLNFKAVWQPDDNNHISFSALFLSNRLDYQVAAEDINTDDRLDLTNNGFSFKWDHSFSNNWNFTLKGYLSNYDSNFIFSEVVASENEQFQQLKDNTVDDLGFTFQTTHSWNRQHRILTGYDFSQTRVTYIINEIQNGEQEANENEDDQLNNHAAYLEYHFQTQTTLLRAGSRLNYLTSNSLFYLEPRLYAETEVLPGMRLKASGEIKNQSISQLIQFEFNEIGVGNNIWVLADAADIPILNIQQGTLGFLYQKNGWNIDVDAYYKKTKGLTTFSRGFRQVSNEDNDNYAEGTSTSRGLDFLVKKKMGRLRTWLSYSLSKTDFLFPDLQSNEFSGNFDQRHVINFSNTFTINHLQISLGWSFASGAPYSSPSGIEVVSDEDEELFLNFSEQNTMRLSNYHKLDASMVYDIPLGSEKTYRLRLGVSALNLYRRENEIEKDFRIETNLDDPEQDPQIIERTKFGLGFTPNLLVRVDF
ncbi:MAG: TonB-dependent receptor [Bacteroidota bacterium]